MKIKTPGGSTKHALVWFNWGQSLHKHTGSKILTTQQTILRCDNVVTTL